MKRAAPRTARTSQGGTQEVDDFLAGVPEEARPDLERLRKLIAAVAPGGSEVISYGIPIYKHNGKLLVGFAAFKSHCAFYVMSPEVMRSHADELKNYETSKGTIRFPAGKPLPTALVRKLVKARLAENRKGKR